MNFTNAFYAVLGVLIGGCLSVIGYLLRTRWERKRNIRKCLFLLLEIWSDIRFSELIDLDIWVDKYLEEARKRFPNEDFDSVDRDFYKKELKPYVVNLLSPTSSTRRERIVGRFDEVIEKLSEDEPLLAYRLNDKPHLRSALASIDSYFAGARQLAATTMNDPAAEALLFSITESIKGAETADLIKTLQEDILEIASTVWLRNKTRQLMQRAYTVDIKDITESVNAVLDRVETAVKDATDAAKPRQDQI